MVLELINGEKLINELCTDKQQDCYVSKLNHQAKNNLK